MFSNYIFDLDGTLTDSRLGIYNALCHALTNMGVNDIPDAIPNGFIGPPLQAGFKSIFNMADNEVEQAVRLFREYYNEKGWFENEPYQGITDVLESLFSSNARIFVATAKFEDYAIRILKHFDIFQYLTDVKGASGHEKKAGKTHLVDALINKYQLKTDETVIIGDTNFDIQAGKETGIKSVAVGYGFTAEEELKKTLPDYYCQEMEDLYNLLCAN
ncbi:MAG: HAD-IA family hydrolase [Bacteroidales bacterium]|nr:HAD-IA family hydrolase [Bacteroidales bacterium]